MIIPPIRKQDSHGSGEYGARRGSRVHRGIDAACYPDSVILSDVNGIVTKIGYPYPPEGAKKEYRYVEVTTEDDYRVRYFYVKPLVEKGAQIIEGNILGLSQDLQKIYPDITHHIHLEVIKDGEYINPHDYLGDY